MVNYGPMRRKDSAQNIRDTKEFTVNIISEPWIEQANACSIDCPPEISEWDISGLTKEPSVRCRIKLLHAVPVPNKLRLAGRQGSQSQGKCIFNGMRGKCFKYADSSEFFADSCFSFCKPLTSWIPRPR